jgi:hypothetical protein
MMKRRLVRRQDKDMADVPVWIKNAREVASALADMEIENQVGLRLCRSSHSLAASSMTSDAVLSSPIAACLICRMTSGFMVVRNCLLSPWGGFRLWVSNSASTVWTMKTIQLQT